MTKVIADTPGIRRNNREVIFRYIRNNPGATKLSLIENLHLSRPTVTGLVNELETAGLIRGEKSDRNTGGRRTMEYSCVPESRYAIGIQLSYTHIRGTIVNLTGEVVETKNAQIPFHVDEAYRKYIGSFYKNLVSASGCRRENIIGTGIALEALTDPKGSKITYYRPGKEEKEGQDFSGLTRYIPGESRLFRDLDTLSYNLGLWKTANICYLSIGPRIGGVIHTSDGVYQGDDIRAGEFGHLQLVQDGRGCYCGNKGCFDAYCNTQVLCEFCGGDLDAFFSGVERGEQKYRKYWETYLDYFASAVFSLRMIFDGSIIVGGELGRFGRFFLQPLRDRLDQKSFFPNEHASEYLFADERGEYAISVGAAMYYIEDVLNRIEKK
jgi:predicted NBD/HSP70 family sugar kinase